MRSDSSNDLVHAVWEFCQLASNDAKLERAAGYEKNEDLTPKNFKKLLKDLDASKFMRVKKLRLLLNDIETKTNLRSLKKTDTDTMPSPAKLLSNVLAMRLNAGWVEPTERDNRFMSEAVSRYFPTQVIAPQSGVVKQQGESRLAIELLEEIKKNICLDDSVRKVRAPNGHELPVCEAFMKDQARSVQEINGTPVFLRILRTNLTSRASSLRKCEI